MSTNSTITALTSDGQYRSIYCHWDGGIEHNGRILREHYTNQLKIDALMAQGNLSLLQPETEKPEGHTYDTPVTGYCIFYGRDRGDQNDNVATGETAKEAFLNNEYGSQPYNYVWDGEHWSVNGRISRSPL